MTQRTRSARGAPARRAARASPVRRAARAATPPLPLRRPAAIAAVLVAALCIVASVTYFIYDPDYWQHLLVGKVIWQMKRVPLTQLWTWPTHGAPDVNSSWGFEALVWPFWSLGGVTGLFVWRWITTLAAFGLLWATARRIGARGLSPLFVLVVCALVYRQRSQIRPETLVAILMGLEIWILETRRHGGPDHSGWIVAIAWVWANCHISYHLGFLILGFHAIEAHRSARRAHTAPAPNGAPSRRPEGSLVAGTGPRKLLSVALAALAVSFINPFTWRALWQPFEYFLFWRHEPIFRIISELGPVDWSLNQRNGLALLGVGWPVLLIWRARRRGLDLVEPLMCAFFTALAFSAQRFIGFYALAAAPYAARDLDEWVGSFPWPAWSEPAPARAALASVACVAVILPELGLDDPPNGVGILTKNYPVAACDFMVAHGVRGRGFNQLRSGGYLLWRFWPQTERLPFMDVHQAGTPEIRRLYVDALVHEPGWRELDRRFRFDWALLSRPPPPGDRMLDFLDADSSWALVFVDDAAALYVKRTGPLAAVGSRFDYRVLGAGQTKLERVAAACATDTLLRARVRDELRRQIADSRQTALSHSLLANLAMVEQRFDEARAELTRALEKDPGTPQAYLRLGTVALATGQPYAALEALERERRRGSGEPGLDLRLGLAYQQLGDIEKARRAYRRELKRDPSNLHVIELLRELDVGAPR